MNKKNFDPFKNLVLDPYEQEIEEHLKHQSPSLTPPSKKKLNLFKQAADNTLNLKKDTTINIRIPHQTKLALQRKANQLGLRYQTLIGSILHQYAHS